MAGKYVYAFGGGKADGAAEMKNLLGGKGANLAEMSAIGIPVPAGFTITTEICTYYYQHGNTYPKNLEKQVLTALKGVEKIMGRKFGDPKKPLLVSVRSGARASMPGMMDTVLNLGLNDEIVKGFEAENPRAAWDSYRRFVQMYGDVVLDLKPKSKLEIDPFEEIIEKLKKKRKIDLDIEMNAGDLKYLVAEFKKAIKKHTGNEFPEDPFDQLWGAIGAVFGSWNNDRAKVYRRLNKIPDDWGTAVNVQSMVFGNLGDDCATGVGFSRNPASGEKAFYGEYLVNAQGEDVVAGIRTPKQIGELAEDMPKVYKQLKKIVTNLDSHYRDMQDIEFTVEHGRLWMLQTRNGKRTGFAACRIATDLVKEKKATPKEALTRLIPDANALDQLLKPVFDQKDKAAAVKGGRLLAKGLAAGPGAATGKVVFHADDAADMAAAKEIVILVRIETSPEDIRGMEASAGILTARGGQTSHAALVARQMGKVCVAGCSDLKIDYKTAKMEVDGKVIKQGDYISIDGFTGEVILGQLKVVSSGVKQALFGKGAAAKKARQSVTFKAYSKLMKWADGYRDLRVRTNADQPDQAAEAIVYGAEGIGLCRTEHMFFDDKRILSVQEMILADNTKGREKALKKLLPYQRKDFIGIFRAMGQRPVTVRLLDPPLHEFLPHTKTGIGALAKEIGVTPKVVSAKVEALHEFNPMLGHRGCRLGITYPEIYLMQTRAIVEAAVVVKKKYKVKCNPEIMIPLVGHWKELTFLREKIEILVAEILSAKNVKMDIHIGTMIELPRASMTADQIAQHADFFSFGTNDLTQTTFGLSRDDSGKFMRTYIEDEGIMPDDPFVSIDVDGVGAFVKMGTDKGRAVKPDLKVGICGEHGGDPSSIQLFHEAGLDYVSCSPSRLPIARLAAAQAAINNPRK